MRQTALIYLHVTARLQLINCFKRRTSHELNFNTQFHLPSSLRVVKYNFNILVNSQMQCSHGIQTQAQKCDVMPFNVDAVYQGGSKFAIETSKQQTAFIGELSAQSSPTSETGHFDALTHILYYCAYSGLCIWLGSCEDRRLNQSRSTAVIPG